MFAQESLANFLDKDYVAYENEPMWGLFARRTPLLIVKDPEFIKDILIKDFTVFSDRGMSVNEKVEPLSQHLFSLEPERWRPLRTKLSPVFTSGKLKEMFYLLIDCAKHFESFLKDQVEKNPIIECRELTAKFTTDVIGVCAFGLQMNALSEEDSDFRKFGRKIFEMNWAKILKFRIRESSSWLYNLLKPIMYDYELNNFFISTMTQTIEYRKKNNVKLNDFVDLLIDIKDHPDKVGDIGETHLIHLYLYCFKFDSIIIIFQEKLRINPLIVVNYYFLQVKNICIRIEFFSEMTNELITAQAFVFFIAGFETSSTTISNALYELAQNHTIQNKLRKEINEELEKNNGELKYESIKNMKYLNKVFQGEIINFKTF